MKTKVIFAIFIVISVIFCGNDVFGQNGKEKIKIVQTEDLGRHYVSVEGAKSGKLYILSSDPLELKDKDSFFIDLFFYDEDGRKTKRINKEFDFEGNDLEVEVFCWEYDEAGRIVKYTYTLNGEMVKIYETHYGIDIEREMIYNAKGELVRDDCFEIKDGKRELIDCK